MSILKKNISANFAGSIWQAVMGLLFVPLYIKFMGVESYGLIGVFATLQGIFVLLDMGLSAALTREMARLSVLPDREQEMRDLARSLEIIYWGVAVFIGLVIMVMAPFIAHRWVKAGQLSPLVIEQAIVIMGFVMAFQWPASFYSGGLAGLQRQVLLNALAVIMSTLRGGGAVLILWLISPTIHAFFVWQIIISVANTFSLAFCLWHQLPRAEKSASFQKQLLAGVWRFAAGMTGISILSAILTQVDKVILSKMLTLEMFGYYTLAGVVAMTIYRLVGPVYSAIYPRFVQLVSLSNQDELIRLYHKSCQLASVLIFPVAVVIALFSYEILLVWTHNPVTAEKTCLLMTILICGTAIHGSMLIPYALQLANGWTSLAIYVNSVAVILLVPLIFFMTRYYGAIGGASVWVLLNSCYLAFTIYFMHRRLLRNEKWRWYWQDICIPLSASIVVAGFGRLFITKAMPPLTMFIYISVISAATLAVATMATATTRAWVLNKVFKIKTA